MYTLSHGPIGVFDSGIGGLTIMKHIVEAMPTYDYIYLGDNARAPYGNRSFDTVYDYTLQCVKWLFDQGCPLVILACNTASAKALRNIQMLDLPNIAPDRRVLGVLRPTTESIGHFTRNGHIGLFATAGTVLSESYVMEINKFFPDIKVSQIACPMFVPLIENNEHINNGATYFIEKYCEQLMAKDPEIDTLLLGCTHYPLIKSQIAQFLPSNINIIDQGAIVAEKLLDYLVRHETINENLTRNFQRVYYTTDDTVSFDQKARDLFDLIISSKHAQIN